MARRNRAIKVRIDKQSRHSTRRATVYESVEGMLTPAKQPSAPTVEAQAAQLGDRRLQGTQRQALAAQIGRTQGNRHVQRLVDILQQSRQVGPRRSRPLEIRAKRTAPVQRRVAVVQRRRRRRTAKYDMGKLVNNATEAFYDITEPKLAKVPKHFKFADAKGRKLAGWTSWEAKGEGPKPKRKGGKVQLTRSRGRWVYSPLSWTISLAVELPRWKNFTDSKTSNADKAEWARFVKCTRVHEQGHVKKARDYIKTAPRRASVPTSTPRRLVARRLLQKLNGLKTRVDADLKKISKAYDVTTKHGATQGATLKPP